ncbi:MAG TPA: TolC family protein [Drouetiella sp.]
MKRSLLQNKLRNSSANRARKFDKTKLQQRGCQLLTAVVSLSMTLPAYAQPQPGGAGTVGTNAGGAGGTSGVSQSSSVTTSPNGTLQGAPASNIGSFGGNAGVQSPRLLPQQSTFPNQQMPIGTPAGGVASPVVIGGQSAPNGRGPSQAERDILLNPANQPDANDNGEFDQQFLLGESIELKLPKASELMPLGAKLPPIRLEANYTEPISLKDAVQYAMSNNLAIRISYANKEQQKWNLLGSASGFLPNIVLNGQDQYLQGSTLIGGLIPSTFHTPNVSAQAGLQYFGFQGGAVLFGTLASLHNFRAAKAQVTGTINDTLLAVTRGYYNLVNNQALLQIQTKAVDVSKAQVQLNQQLESAGTGTKFQVLQSETQLARDEQNLLIQEVALRNSSIDLATVLNVNSAVNFLSVESTVKKVRLIDPSMDINRLIALAILNRPELKQYEQLRIAARRQIQIAAAPLYPQLQFYANSLGNGATFGKTYQFNPGSFTTVPVAAPAAGPVLNTKPFTQVGAATTSGTGQTGATVAAGEQYTGPSYSSRQMRQSYSIGYRIDWNFPALGMGSVTAINAARQNARIALLNSNQSLINILQQVRESYLNSQTAERQIEVADKAVVSATEELRLSRVRLANGVGTNIDVINAQRDFITALVNKANAIITFNLAQVQLLHDTGLISVETLTSGRLVRQ